MNAEEYYKEARKKALKIWEEREILTMPKDLKFKVTKFYKNNGKEKLEKFKGKIVKKYNLPINLHWDEKEGLSNLAYSDIGLDFNGMDNQFVWANVDSKKIKEPFLKIIKQYKLLLDNKN